MASLRKKIERQIAKMPKYQIQDEAFQSQNIARTRAFGRDRDVQMERENIQQGAEDAISRVQDVSSSTSDVLSTVAAIEAGRGQNIRGLAQDEAGRRSQGVGELYGANQMMIDEKDKAWRQNVYAPWEAKLRSMQEKKARRTAFWNTVGGAIIDPGNFSGMFTNKTPQQTGEIGGSAQAQQTGQDQEQQSKFKQMIPMIASLFSDERLKENITPSERGIGVINSLNVVEYNYRSDSEHHIGLLAQQVKCVLPEAVVDGEYMKVNYNEIVPVLIKAIQDQQKQINDLKDKLSSK